MLSYEIHKYNRTKSTLNGTRLIALGEVLRVAKTTLRGKSFVYDSLLVPHNEISQQVRKSMYRVIEK